MGERLFLGFLADSIENVGKTVSPCCRLHFWSELAGNQGKDIKSRTNLNFPRYRITDFGVVPLSVQKKKNFCIDLQWENGVSILVHSILIGSSSKEKGRW